MSIRMYSAGQLDQRIKFQQRSAAADVLHEVVGAWVDVGSPLWAKVEPLTGRDGLAAGAMRNVVTTRFVIRYRPGVVGNEQLRLVWLKTGEPFEIVSALPVDGSTEWIEIMAAHGVRDGR